MHVSTGVAGGSVGAGGAVGSDGVAQDAFATAVVGAGLASQGLQGRIAAGIPHGVEIGAGGAGVLNEEVAGITLKTDSR